ncbi:MAG: hypothetical protein M1814_000883 [Vezdaea aestivalis]|nr:MAG: hypothetical protein M1814_000883 [Vezdaea aestivalis]
MASPANLPAGFLTGSAPGGISKRHLDFTSVGLDEYKDRYAVVLDNVVSASECTIWLAAAEARDEWQPAMVNVGGGRQAMALDVRKSGRIIWDDEDLVGRLWDKVKDEVKEIALIEHPEWASTIGTKKLAKQIDWRVRGCNERMRILKYGPGDYFQPHCDGTYSDPETHAISYFTLHLYMNDATTNPEGELVGGATRFESYRINNQGRELDVNPKVGSVLIFAQRGLWHCGAPVTKGTKITLRTDIMFDKVKRTEEEETETKVH